MTLAGTVPNDHQCCGSGSASFWEARVDPAPHLNGKLDPDTDPHQSEMGEALVVILEHWRVQIRKKVSGRIRIRIRVKLIGRIRVKGIRIRIRIKVQSRIWIRIKLCDARNTVDHSCDNFFILISIVVQVCTTTTRAVTTMTRRRGSTMTETAGTTSASTQRARHGEIKTRSKEIKLKRWRERTD